MHERVTAAPEVLTIGPAGADRSRGPVAVAAAAARLGRRAVAIPAVAQHELDFAAIRGAGVLWVALGALAAEPGRSGTLAAMESRARRGLTILDLEMTDHDLAEFSSASELRRWAREGLDYATVAVGRLASCAAVTGENDPVLAGWALLGHGVRLAVIRHGAEVLAMDTARQVRAGPVSEASADGAFGGALGHGLLAGWELDAVARFAARASYPG